MRLAAILQHDMPPRGPTNGREPAACRRHYTDLCMRARAHTHTHTQCGNRTTTSAQDGSAARAAPPRHPSSPAIRQATHSATAPSRRAPHETASRRFALQLPFVASRLDLPWPCPSASSWLWRGTRAPSCSPDQVIVRRTPCILTGPRHTTMHCRRIAHCPSNACRPMTTRNSAPRRAESRCRKKLSGGYIHKIFNLHQRYTPTPPSYADNNTGFLQPSG